MNFDNEPETRMMPPAKLGKSFLLVVGCYVLSFVTMWGTFVGLGMVVFPEVYQQLMENEPEVIRQTFENDPESIFPRKMYWAWLLANAVVSLCIGWTIARLAPFGKFPHAIFLAVLMFVSGLQQAISAPQSSKWMFVLIMGVFPIAILMGASLALSSKTEEKLIDG